MTQATPRRVDIDVDPAGCRPTGCGWYHGAWPVLRSLGLVATPHRHADFFAAALGEAARAGATRVLVSGAADPAMVEVAIDAFRAESVEAEVTVLDRCITPVDRAVTQLPGVTGWVADVFDVEGPARFDVLCTHGLFPLVRTARRTELAQRWAELLVTGGRIVTTSSLSAADARDPVVFDEAAVEAYVERASAAAQGTDLDLGSVAALARTWAERAAIHPVRSVDDITGALEPAGFDVTVREREIEGRVGATGGPWSARTATYAEIVAVRR